MKKTIKTGFMIALFLICAFLLLPFIISESKSEKQTDQSFQAQPQVYSSNPLTALMQRARNLLASAHGQQARAEAQQQAKKARKARHAKAALAAQKHADNADAAQANAAAAQADGYNNDAAYYKGSSEAYSQQPVRLARYQNAQQSQTLERTPNTNNALFLADARAGEYAPNGTRNAYHPTRTAYAKNNKRLAAFSNFYTTPAQAAGALGIQAGRAVSDNIYPYYNNRDIDRIITDIATLRANARYPNPQTEAELLARDEMIKKEREKNIKHLNDLFWRSVVDPDTPGPQPEIDDFSKNDPLANVILDLENHSAVKSTAFVTTPDDAQAQPDNSSEELLNEVLAKNNLRLQDLSREEQQSLTQEIPLAVILGTTHEETWQQVQDELDFLKKQQEQEEANSDKPQKESKQTPQNAQGKQPSEYQKILESYLWLNSAAGGNQEYIWVAAQNRKNTRDLADAVSAAHARFVGDPLGKEATLFAQYMLDYTGQNAAGTAQASAGGAAPTRSVPADAEAEEADEEEEYEEDDETLLNTAQDIFTMAREFDAFTPYIPYTKEDIARLNQRNGEQSADQGNDSNAAGNDTRFYVSNRYQAHQLNGQMDPSALLVDPKSFEQNDSREKLIKAIYQARINNLNARRQGNRDLADNLNAGAVEALSSQLGNNTAGQNF